jgi:hypothetical protein
VPDVFHRIDIEARVGVLVEGTEADQFLAAAMQFDAPRLRQPFDRDFPLDALQQLIRESGHLCSFFGPFPVFF